MHDLDDSVLHKISQRKTNTISVHLYVESKENKTNDQTKQDQKNS